MILITLGVSDLVRARRFYAGLGFAGISLAHNVRSEPEVDAVLSKPPATIEWE